MSSRPMRNPQLAWREIDGEIVIISPEDSQVHELNETAALVWKRANGDETEEEIAAEIAAQYEVSLAQARDDVAELLAQFQEKQMILAVAVAKG